jgi:hypothetical protein
MGDAFVELLQNFASALAKGQYSSLGSIAAEIQEFATQSGNSTYKEIGSACALGAAALTTVTPEVVAIGEIIYVIYDTLYYYYYTNYTETLDASSLQDQLTQIKTQTLADALANPGEDYSNKLALVTVAESLLLASSKN